MPRDPDDKTEQFSKPEPALDPESTSSFDLDAVRAAMSGDEKLQPALTIVNGPQTGKVIPIEHGPVTVGRHESCEVLLMGRGVSRKHLRLERLGDEVTVEDLQSTNGTLVNGEIILRHRLRPGDRIQLGPDTRLKLSYEDTQELTVRAEKYEESIRDDLTGAYNRRFFRLTLTHELAFASRHGAPTSVALIDLDHFKQTNDRFGHPAGDRVLCALVGKIMESSRTDDIVARLGSEEFRLTLRGLNARQAYDAAERLREMVAALRIRIEGEPLSVTASIGVATLRDGGPSEVDDFIEEADRHLYRAKRDGRNCTRGPDLRPSS